MRRRSGYSLAACGALASLLPYGIASADWEAVPDVRMEVEANDNPRLGQRSDEADPEALDEHTATRMLMDSRIRLRNTGPRGELIVQPRFRIDAYSDEVDEELEREDLYLTSRAEYRWTRATAGMRLNLSRESIISAEIADTDLLDPDDLVDPVDTDTGVLDDLEESRERAIFAPYAELSISERSALLLDARHLDVSYTGNLQRTRSDFSDTMLSIGVGRTIDARTGAAARVIVSTFEADATSNQTDTVGIEGSFNRELSAIWSFSLITGLQRSEFTFVDEQGERVDNAATNYTMGLSFAKETEVSTFDIGLFRLLNPNAIGFLVERNELRLAFSRRLSERVTAGFGLRAFDQGTLDREGGDREFVRADFDIEWAFTPSWAFTARYGAANQDFEAVDRRDGSANILSIGAAYRGLSRGDTR